MKKAKQFQLMFGVKNIFISTEVFNIIALVLVVGSLKDYNLILPVGFKRLFAALTGCLFLTSAPSIDSVRMVS